MVIPTESFPPLAKEVGVDREDGPTAGCPLVHHVGAMLQHCS